MASNPTRYQFSIDALTVYTGGNALMTMVQPNNVLMLGGGGTTLSAAYSGGGTTVAPYINSGTTTFGNYSTETIININRATTINTNASTSTYVVFTTNGNMAYGFTSLSEPKAGSYTELHQALTELHNLDDDDDWKIQTPVYSASLQVAAALLENDIPKPGVFTHGSKSVVFNWSGKEVDLYLTVSKSRLSVLVSSTEGIEYRTEFSADSGEDTNRFFSALGTMRLLAPPENSVAPTVASNK